MSGFRGDAIERGVLFLPPLDRSCTEPTTRGLYFSMIAPIAIMARRARYAGLAMWQVIALSMSLNGHPLPGRESGVRVFHSFIPIASSGATAAGRV